MHQRPDIIARAFHMKVEAILADNLKYDILGHVDAFVMVKETQKRHLPYICSSPWCHVTNPGLPMILITLCLQRFRTKKQIQNYIALSHHT